MWEDRIILMGYPDDFETFGEFKDAVWEALRDAGLDTQVTLVVDYK